MMNSHYIHKKHLSDVLLFGTSIDVLSATVHEMN